MSSGAWLALWEKPVLKLPVASCMPCSFKSFPLDFSTEFMSTMQVLLQLSVIYLFFGPCEGLSMSLVS